MEQRANYLIAGAFVALIFLTIIFVTAVLPAMTFNPEPSPAAVKYTAQQLRGRQIYGREGCFYCHTQFTRYQDREAGEMVQAGDYVYDRPHYLGTERTGPDLSNIGGKYASAWHVAHHLHPRKVKPGSIMPNYDFLTESEMADLVAYLQTLGVKRIQPSWLVPPQEFRDKWEIIAEKVDVNSYAIANSGRGIYMQNCAQCHGVQGKGNGPVSATMQKKPANLTRPYYKAYSDAMFYWRIHEAVPGTRMPRWGKSLSDEDIAYLVAFVKTLPKTTEADPGFKETVSQAQVEHYEPMESNFYQVEELQRLAEEPYVYGGGRE